MIDTDAITAGNQSTYSLIGTTIDDKYHIESKLGEGGMGAVYLSTRLMIGDTVAVKILHSTRVSEPQAIERFRREAQAAARLKHHNAVTIYDFGVSKEGLVYLVMELAEGQSLRDIIKHQGAVTPSAAAEIMSQVCAALDAAHRQNIVHRDMKPDNIIVDVTNTGLRVKVLDFGIAKMRDLTASNLTQTGAVMGTPYYMSPEHCMGEELDHRSDIYSLGIVLYEMLAGVVPFNSPISTAVIVQHVNQAPPSLRALNASISPGVEAVVMHALEKRRESRPQTAVQLAQELIAAVQRIPFTPHSGGSISVIPPYSTPSSTTPAATPVTGAGLAPTIQMTTPSGISEARTLAPAKHRSRLKLAVVIVIAAIVLAVLMWSKREKTASPAIIDSAEVETFREGSPVPTPAGEADYSKLGFLNVSKESYVTISDIAFSPDGNFLAISGGKDSEWNKYTQVMTKYPGQVLLWNINSNESRRLTGLRSRAHSVAFSPDGRDLAAGASEQIRIWDLSSSSGKSISDNNGGINLHRLAYTPDGQGIVSFSDQPKVWDAQTGALRRILNLPNPQGNSGHISANGERLVSFEGRGWDDTSGKFDYTSGTITVWNLRSGTAERSFSWKGTDYTGIAISQDSATIATSETSGELKVFDTNTGKLLSSFKGERISGVLSFSPDGKTLATRSESGDSVMLWEVQSGKLIKSLRENGAYFQLIRFSADGHKVAVANFTGVIVWSIPSS